MSVEQELTKSMTITDKELDRWQALADAAKKARDELGLATSVINMVDETKELQDAVPRLIAALRDEKRASMRFAAEMCRQNDDITQLEAERDELRAEVERLGPHEVNCGGQTMWQCGSCERRLGRDWKP